MRVPSHGIGMTSQRTRDRLVERLREEGIVSEAVLEAIRATPRHLFVDEALASRAYEDTALPIGHGQTISQPYIVAKMTELLVGEQRPGRVLEIGTGSGYQAAVLAQLADEVCTVERLEVLVQQARRRFRELGLRNVRTKVSEGELGWAERGPYDAIMVTAAPRRLPSGLCEQLSLDGRMVVPVGGPRTQTLTLIIRAPQGMSQTEVERVSFVPLVGGGA